MALLIDLLQNTLQEIYLALKEYTFETTLIAIVSVMAYRLTMHYLPKVAKTLRSRNIYGIDINKTTPEERAIFAEQRRRGCTNDKEFESRAIPESTGIIVGAVYLSTLVIVILLLNVDISVMSGPLITVTVMLLLGFVDDVLDIAWRHKLLLSALGSFPLILVYDGSRSILIPPLLTQKLLPLLHALNRISSNTSSLIMKNLSSFTSLLSTTSNIYSDDNNNNIINNVNRSYAHNSALFNTSNCSVSNEPCSLHNFSASKSNNSFTSITSSSSSSSSLLLLLQKGITYLTTHFEWVTEVISFTPRADYLLLSLGPLYLVYLSLLCIFCTNSINILAGVNGVEVGQSLVIAVALVLYNLSELRPSSVSKALSSSLASMNTYERNSANANSSTTNQGIPLTSYTSIISNSNNNNNNCNASEILTSVLNTSLNQLSDNSNTMTSDNHQLRALMLLGPFIGVSFALWQYNKYPSRVFVGDSYTYFAGTVLAVAGITGVYSKTLLLFFIPQLFNFIISLPQLFGLVTCPRHRVPLWDKEADVLCNSHNYTILNVILYFTGPLHERTLTRVFLFTQILTCLFGFVLREWITLQMY